MGTHKEALVDTAKAAVPIGGGFFMQWLRLHDQQITDLTHFFGLCSVIVGLVWWLIRIYRDLKTPDRKKNDE